MVSQVKDTETTEKELSFMDHLEALRWHLIRTTIAIVILAVLAFNNIELIVDSILFAPSTPDFITNRLFAQLSDSIGSDFLRINSKVLHIQNLKLPGQFVSHIKISLLTGVIVGFPYFMWEIWSFIKPALYKEERRHARGIVFFSSILFFIGISFGYYIISPLSIHFLGSYSISSIVENHIDMLSYLKNITSIIFAGGIVFELPIVVFFLGKAGIVTSTMMKRYRRHAIVVLLLLSAIITPPEIYSQIMVCIPLVILYEVSINIVKRIEKSRTALQVQEK